MEPIEVSTYETWRAMEKLVTEGLVKYVSTTILRGVGTGEAGEARASPDFRG